MSYRAPFHKTMGDFDRVELNAQGFAGNDWLAITMHVGNDVDQVTITLRSDEAVRDLHYALGSYLAHISPEKSTA